MGLLNNSNKIVGIVSAKGGVGKTTTVANLGATLINLFNKNVLIIDTNVNTGNLGLYLGLTYHPASLYKIIKDPVSILNSIHKHKSGLHVIPSSFVKERRAINPSALNKKLKKLTSYDYIFLDSAPGTEEDAKLTIKSSDILLLIITPDFPSIGTAFKTIELAKKLHVPICGAIINKARGKSYEITPEEIEASLGVPVIATIPYDEKVSESVYMRMPAVLYSPRSKASVSYKKLSALLLGKKIARKPMSRRFTEFFK